jgi:steroid delta-isomerase-like uncharacterized protein
MTTAQIQNRREAIVIEHVAAENRHDPDGTVATFHEPRYDVPAMGPAGQASGPQAVRDLLGGLWTGFPDWHAEPTTPFHHSERSVFVEVRMTGTHQAEFAAIPATGRRIDVRVGCLFEFDGTHLICERVYFDFATILQQLGVLHASKGARV